MIRSSVSTTPRVKLNVQAVAQPSRLPVPQPKIPACRTLLGQIEHPTYWQSAALRAPRGEAGDSQQPLYGKARVIAARLRKCLEAEEAFEALVAAKEVPRADKEKALQVAQKALEEVAWVLERYPRDAAHPPRELVEGVLSVAIPERLRELSRAYAIPLPPASESESSARDDFAEKMAKQHRGRLSPRALEWLTEAAKRWQAYQQAEAALLRPEGRDSQEALGAFCRALWAVQDQLEAFAPLSFAGVANGSTWKGATERAAALVALTLQFLPEDRRFVSKGQALPQRPRPEAADNGWSADAHAMIRTLPMRRRG